MISKTFPTLSRMEMKSDRNEINFHSISWWLITRSQPAGAPASPSRISKFWASCNFPWLWNIATLAIKEIGPFLCRSQDIRYHSRIPFIVLMSALDSRPFLACVPSALPCLVLPSAFRGPSHSHISTEKQIFDHYWGPMGEKGKIGSLSSRSLKHNGEKNWPIDSMHSQSNPSRFFCCCWNWQTDSKIDIRIQIPRMVKTISKEKNKVGGLILSDFKT